MKRAICLFLLVSLCVCCLPSCGENFAAATTMAKAEKALTENSYIPSMDMKYSCEDTVTDIVFNAFIKEIPAIVNGNDIYIDMSAETMEAEQGIVFTVVDEVLYSYSTYTETPSKVKTMVKGELLTDFMQDCRIIMPVGVKYFDSLTMQTVSGKQVITCTALTSDGMARMLDMIADPLALLNATAMLKSLTMTATITYDKFETVSLNATFLVTQTEKNETHEVDLTMTARYDYTDVDPIDIPADDDEYTWVAYETIMGG